MAYYSNDDQLVTSLLVSSQISDYKVDLPMNSSVELMFGNVSLCSYICIKFYVIRCKQLLVLKSSCVHVSGVSYPLKPSLQHV